MSLSSKRVGFFFAREKVHIIGHTQRIFFVKILTVLDEKRNQKKKYLKQKTPDKLNPISTRSFWTIVVVVRSVMLAVPRGAALRLVVPRSAARGGRGKLSTFSSSSLRGPTRRRGIFVVVVSKSSSSSSSDNVEPSDAPGEGKKRFPNANEGSGDVEPRKYKHPGNEGRAVTYSFDVDAVGTFRGLVDVKYDDDDFDGAKPMDAPGEGKRRAPDAGQEREKDDGWDAMKGHGLMFGYVEERKEEMEF